MTIQQRSSRATILRMGTRWQGSGSYKIVGPQDWLNLVASKVSIVTFQHCPYRLSQSFCWKSQSTWKLGKNQQKKHQIKSCLAHLSNESSSPRVSVYFLSDHKGVGPGRSPVSASVHLAPFTPGSSTALFLLSLPALCYLPGSWLWLGNMASLLWSSTSPSTSPLLSLGKGIMSNVFPPARVEFWVTFSREKSYLTVGY